MGISKLQEVRPAGRGYRGVDSSAFLRRLARVFNEALGSGMWKVMSAEAKRPDLHFQFGPRQQLVHDLIARNHAFEASV